MRIKYTIVLAVLGLALTSTGKKTVKERYKFPVPAFFPSMPQPGQNIVTRAGAELGRFLFYDPILSRDSSFSCASCHRQSAAFSDGLVTFSKGINGVPQKRNTPPLFNLAWHDTYFWDGRATSIEAQVFHPVREANEMNMTWLEATERLNRSVFYKARFNAVFGDVTIDSVLVSNAISQFERTLISYRSKYDRVLNLKETFTHEEAEGFELVNNMTKGDCLHCHTTDANALGSTFGFSNNGLDSFKNADSYGDAGRGGVTGRRQDNGKFKIPTLRNIGLTGPYMHDGRFSTLEQVIDFYSEGVNVCVNIDSKMGFAGKRGAHLSAYEKKCILAFLHTLTDSAFVSDPAFGNPFERKE